MGLIFNANQETVNTKCPTEGPHTNTEMHVGTNLHAATDPSELKGHAKSCNVFLSSHAVLDRGCAFTA